jgi:hypothetical protein
MTIDTVRGKFGRTPRVSRRSRTKEPESEPIAIGETDKDIFNCPTCSRPLAVGSAHCPACGTRLIIGVQAKKAAAFIGIGLVLGTMLGGAAMVVTSSLARAVDGALPQDTVLPSGAPAFTSAPPIAIDPTVPAEALSALRQSALLNQRLADGSARLADAVRAKPLDTADIARALRAMAADAAFGERIVLDISKWGDASAVSSGLAEFYNAVGGKAREGLKASLTNEKAYTSAGREMLALVGTLGELDAASRDLAGGAGLDLPTVDLGSD